MNEPQLSAEMEKRFSKIMLEWIESQWKIEQAHQNGEPYTRMKFEADANEVENRLEHFLATALEEQRKQILSEVNRIVRDVAQRNNIKVGTSLFGYHYEVCSELAKLNQLKEGGGNE